MYLLAPGIKSDPIRRWALPDRVFFAAGACHILAYAFIERYPHAGFRPVWIKPREGFTGNHIVALAGGTSFDYRGYCEWSSVLAHTFRKARRSFPGWDADLVELPVAVLVSEALSRTYEGLWLREPSQFHQDALPRARAFVARFPSPTLAGAADS